MRRGASESDGVTSTGRGNAAAPADTPPASPRRKPRRLRGAHEPRASPRPRRRGLGSFGRSRARAGAADCASPRLPRAGARKSRCETDSDLAARTLARGVRKRGRRRRNTLRIPFVFEGGRLGRRSPERPIPSSHRESFASLPAARGENGASGARAHAHEKTVSALAPAVVRLKGPLHKEGES